MLFCVLIDSLWVGTTSHSANYLSFVQSYGKMIFSSRACKLLHVKLVQYSCLSFHNICWIHFVGSERNMSKLTLDGVDVMGECLAQEVGFLLLLQIVIDERIHLEFKRSIYLLCESIHFTLCFVINRMLEF